MPFLPSYRTVPYRTVPDRAVRYRTVLYLLNVYVYSRTVPVRYGTVLWYSTDVPYCTYILYPAVPYRTVPYLHRTYGTVQYGTDSTVQIVALKS